MRSNGFLYFLVGPCNAEEGEEKIKKFENLAFLNLFILFYAAEFCQSFLRSNGIGALFDLLAGPDDGVRLVAAKALTVAALSTPELTRSEVHARNGGPVLASLLRTDNEFVRYKSPSSPYAYTPLTWSCNELCVCCAHFLTQV
jgi:hypothetical protein